MKRHTIEIERNAFGNFAQNTLGTDALNAIASIPGTDDIQIEEEGNEVVVISYLWTARDDFEDTATVLAKYYCRRVGWE